MYILIRVCLVSFVCCPLQKLVEIIFFPVFCKSLKQKLGKMRQKEHIFALFPNAVQHKNNGLMSMGFSGIFESLGCSGGSIGLSRTGQVLAFQRLGVEVFTSSNFYCNVEKCFVGSNVTSILSAQHPNADQNIQHST